jgi:ABC-type nitrate/sulfonate/bicarbonate transport system substrate-binding protein
MKITKMLAAVAGTTLAVTALAACGSSGDEPAAGGSTDMAIQVLQLPNQVYDLLVQVGQDEGFFKDHGVTISTEKYPLSLEASQAIKATDSDALQMTAGSLVSSWQAGVRLKYFCGT